jgi:multidrug efflux pump subunit AcrB
MWLIRLALHNPYAVVVLCLAILIIGLTTTVRLPVDILPQFKVPAVQILTLYPGMPTHVVERDITSRLERWTSQANGIARQESRSLLGVSVIKDFFREDIDPNTALSQVSSLAISDLYYLPPGTIPPMVMPFDPTATQPLALLALSSATLDETALYDVAYFEIRNLLSGTPGVIAPAVYGGKLRRILIYTDKDKLNAHGLSPMDVVRAIRRQNVFIPTGTAKIGDYDYQIESNAMVPAVPDFNAIPIKYEDGRPVLVRDIGEAKDSFAIQTNAVLIGGKRAVYIPIYRQPGANTIEVVDGIKAAIPGIRQTVTSGKEIDMDVIVDQSVYVRAAIASLEQEGILGAGLAAFMILLFLGSVRSTLIIALSLPLSILAAFIALYYTGQTINAMTLGGLALAVGMLMDNGIVVLENVARHLESGKTPEQAARVAAMEVATPVLVATTTLCVVFAPVMFLTGIGKFLFTPLALAVIFAILASYVMSMALVPAACARFLKPGGSAHGKAQRRSLFERAYGHLQRGYARALRTALQYRRATLLAILGAFAFSLLLLPRLGQELFPPVDSGQFMVNVRAPSGTRMERTEAIARRVEELIRATLPAKDIQKIVSNVGILYDWPAAYTPNAGTHDAFVLVQLSERRQKSAPAYADRLRRTLPQRLPGVQLTFNTGGLISSALNFGLPSPINLQVQGPSLEKSYQIARIIREHMAQVNGAVDVRIEQMLDAPTLNLEVDRLRAASVGLTQEAVVQNVVSALNSSVTFLPSFWLDEKSGNHYFVGVTYWEDNINSHETIQDIPITGPGQPQPVALRNIMAMSTAKGPVDVNHVNIRPVIDVYANVQGRDIGSVAVDIQRFLHRLQLPEGYKVTLAGETAAMQESFGSLGFGLLLAVALVYFLLVAQLRSFLDPFIIMFAVPMGFIGVLLMLFLTDTTLNVQSFMGVVMMVGLSVSYSLLLVNFANQLLGEGIALEEAVVSAATIRLRPILMTSLAAILGLVPMALHTGEANMPLARAVIGGLSASAVLTLFLVPILYSYMKRTAPSSDTNPATAEEQ